MTHEGNADQKHSEIPLHTHQDGSHQRDGQEQAVAGTQGNWISQIPLAGMQSGMAALENSLAVPQKGTRRTTL